MCPPDKELLECVSDCPRTCQNPYVNSENKACFKNCRSGCACKNGTVIDEGRDGVCVPLKECTCSHRGKIFMPGEILRHESKRW